jgi:hypothetical protein
LGLRGWVHQGTDKQEIKMRIWQVRLAVAAAALAVSVPTAAAAAPAQREADGYTRYELLAPGSGKFRIVYEISAVASGATAYCNPIRPGSVASDERVSDRATGKPLRWRVVDAAAAARACGVRDAEPGLEFIQVDLARPVPPGGGEARVLIEKTYQDPKSYFATSGGDIVFDRPLGVKRNAVVLPAGYVLASSNYPAQILEDGGRVLVSFWNVTPAQAPLRIVARRARVTRQSPAPLGGEAERAHQSRNIVYYLNPPETHSFALTHDYTETRAGASTYVNIVRAGSEVANPSATNLDTGERIAPTLIAGRAVKEAEPEAEDVGPDTKAVLFRFPAVRAGESLRLRIAETYTDPGRYRLQEDGSLLWERSLGRADNVVVLPAGWTPVSSNMPCTVETQPDGRVRLTYMNPRPDELVVRLVARRVR